MDRKKFFAHMRSSGGVSGAGVKIMDAVSNRSSREYLKPENSRPAIGCPPMKRHFAFCVRSRSSLQITPFTPPQSNTRAPSAKRCACVRM